MSQAVAVVTDSSAALDPAEAGREGVLVIPLQVAVGGRTFDDVAQIDAAAVAEALAAWSPVTTSRPAPQRFADAYEAAAARGAASVVSVHLSAALSGTADSARLAAADALVPVDVVDSGSLAMGLGFPVLAAARAARRGGTRQQVAAAARACAAETMTYFYVDDLEHLRRSGRLGTAATFLGSALAIKPLLHITGGTIVPLEKVRTSGRAIARLADLAVSAAGERRVDVAVHHLAAPARAGTLARQLTDRVPGLASMRVTEVGPAVGVHAGPGMLGITVAPAIPH
ncbi:DegV domain-containing protein [Sphaerisporangium rufum]|uniref:DegV domain-containing protein n=1 Tax=Sphaerisporangium rufum TaxID=1381558 RepID=A0A919V185_9ACTN|nr:DegV family protein [Sphaerisporangium rufum]GII78312.1 DegV domain-containing protein [Sphaerisporangium rufum]